MRILFLAHRLPYPPDKGDKIRSFRELEGLAQHHEVDLFCFYDQPEDRQYVPQVQRYCREVYAEELSWFRSRAQAALAAAMGRPFTTAFYHSPTMARHVREALSARNYDLIFVFSSSMAPYVESASQPVILDMVDVDSDKWTQYAKHTPAPASWLWLAEGKNLAKCEEQWTRKFSMTLLCTGAEVEILKRNLPDERIEALENHLDTNYFNPAGIEVSPEIAALQPYIIFTGSMDYFPNIDAVTFFYQNVFPRIRAQVPNARFVIAGRNPSREILRIARDPAVIVTGTVSDMRPYLLGASAAVAPLRVARGVQNKILEAMAMGLSVVASGVAAKALPNDLLPAIHVQDDPEQIANFLIGQLQRVLPATQATIRHTLLEYYSRLGWRDRLEGILRRVVLPRQQSGARQQNENGLAPIADEFAVTTAREEFAPIKAQKR
jgi:sugar transferase (PEP-CTERM/EpsH1 system associated)